MPTLALTLPTFVSPCCLRKHANPSRVRSARGCSAKMVLAILISSTPVIDRVAGSESEGASTFASKADDMGFKLLLSGPPFRQWRHSGNWAFEDGEVYWRRVDKQGSTDRNDLHFTGRLPGNCELLFEWKQSGDKRKGGYPGFGFNAGDGVSVDYWLLPHLAIRLSTRGMDDNSPENHIVPSGFYQGGSPKDYSKPSGEWNQSRIIFRNSRIVFWINKAVVYDLDLQKELAIDDKDPFSETLRAALPEWMNRKKRGLYLTVIAPGPDTLDKSPVRVRSLRIRKLDDQESPKSTGEYAVQGNAGLDWRTHGLFSKIVLSPRQMLRAGVELQPRKRFAAIADLANPGGTTDRDVIRSYCSYLYQGVVHESEIKTLCVVEYKTPRKATRTSETRGGGKRVPTATLSVSPKAGVTMLEMVSRQKAEALSVHLRNVARESQHPDEVWQSGSHVIYLSASRTASTKCYKAIQEHVARGLFPSRNP